MPKTKVRKMTKKEMKDVQDARCFAALNAFGTGGAGTARQIADLAGDTEQGGFCTEGQARAAMKRFIALGLVVETEEPIRTGRRAQTGYRLTLLGRSIIDFIEEPNL